MTSIDLMAQAKLRIADNPELADFIGGADTADIEQASSILNVEFPSSYRLFLHDFGVGDFNGYEFGMSQNDLSGEGWPNVIWVNKKLRREVNFPIHMLAVAHTGYGPWYCIDTSMKDQRDEAPVCLCSPQGEKMETVHDSFVSFFAELVGRD